MSKLPGWRVSASLTDSFDPYILAGDGMTLIFDKLPLDASQYKKEYKFITAKIDRKLGGQYVIKKYSEKEALADIPKKVISGSGVGYGEECHIICRLEDVTNVETVGGTTKAVAIVDVEGIIPTNELDLFAKYVAGHPEEFPHDQYVDLYIPEY